MLLTPSLGSQGGQKVAKGALNISGDAKPSTQLNLMG